MPATAAVRPTTAARDAYPRPRSNDMPTPATAAGPGGAAPSTVASTPGRTGLGSAAPGDGRARSQAGTRLISSTVITTAMNPTPSTATLTVTPGWISARRAIPIGVAGESAIATSTATAAPAPATTAERAGGT